MIKELKYFNKSDVLHIGIHKNISCLVITPSKVPSVGLVTQRCLKCICLKRARIFGKKSYLEHFSGFSIMYGLKSIKLSRWSSHYCLIAGVIAISRDMKSLQKSVHGRTAAPVDSGKLSKS